MVGYYGCQSLCGLPLCAPVAHPYFCFRMITWVNVSGFSPNLVCALILRRSSLGLLMGTFHQFLTSYLSATCLYFSFWMITWGNINGFPPNLVCALILWKSCLGLLMYKFSQYLIELYGHHMIVAWYYQFTFSFCVPEKSRHFTSIWAIPEATEFAPPSWSKYFCLESKLD